MLGRIVRRLGLGLGIVFVVVTLTFMDAARHALGLDRPVLVRYVTWLADFARGQWGSSVAQQRPVLRIIADALPHTLLLSLSSLLVTYVFGLLIGVIQAMKRRSLVDTGLTVGTLLIYGMPAYWLAIMLVLVFAYGAARFDWPAWLQFPALGVAGLDADFLGPWDRLADRVRHLTLPLATLGAIGAAGTARFVRGSVLDVRGQEFVRTARAKGLPPTRVEMRHVLRNALLPVVTLLGLSLPALFSGTVFVEVIFAWPGVGRVMVDAVGARDYPVVMATTAIFAVLVIVGNLLADLLYAVADPRLRGTAR
jgi:peptide/nickel transport system permease protein